MSEEVDSSGPEDAFGQDALDSPALLGTVRLAQSALRSPPPPVLAEAESRRLVETLMQEAALSPRVLRELAAHTPAAPWWERLRFWRRR